MSPGVQQLGYLAFQVKDLGAWERFGADVLGLDVVGRRPDGGFALRMDGRAQRIQVEPGEADDLATVGLEVESPETLEALGEALRGAGVSVEAGSEQQTAERRVERLLRLRDPAGNPVELFVGAARAAEPFRSKLVPEGFVAEEQGLGHIVLSAENHAESERFYAGLLGFRLSDHIRCEFHGFAVDLAFFHVNRRHHSVAFGSRQKKRLHHFMLEVRSLDDVGLCFDRTLGAGLPIMQTLGRHPNDRMFSFYAKTPSGFQFEYGWGGREVDDATWKPTSYDRVSEWGHHPPQLLSPSKAR